MADTRYFNFHFRNADDVNPMEQEHLHPQQAEALAASQAARFVEAAERFEQAAGDGHDLHLDGLAPVVVMSDENALRNRLERDYTNQEEAQIDITRHVPVINHILTRLSQWGIGEEFAVDITPDNMERVIEALNRAAEEGEQVERVSQQLIQYEGEANLDDVRDEFNQAKHDSLLRDLDTISR